MYGEHLMEDTLYGRMDQTLVELVEEIKKMKVGEDTSKDVVIYAVGLWAY